MTHHPGRERGHPQGLTAQYMPAKEQCIHHYTLGMRLVLTGQPGNETAEYWTAWE